jgi:COP9 signalosome complex subunit 12
VREAFSQCFAHRAPREASHRSRKLGVVALAVLAFRLWFRLHTPRQAKHVVAAIEKDSFLSAALAEGAFPPSQTVPYRYFTGRLAAAEDGYARADAALTFALAHTPAAYADNRRRILLALIPVRLHLGVAPSPRLLAKHGLAGVFGGIVAGVTRGDLRAFRAALDAHADAFIAAGTYLILEKLQALVIRTFVRRAAAHLKTTQLRLPVLAAALSSTRLCAPGYAVDDGELECILAGLVARKLIRGYISHRPPVLVIARDRPFPRVSEAVGGGA